MARSPRQFLAQLSLRSAADTVRGESVLLTLAFGFLLVQGVRFVIPAVLPSIRLTFGISNAVGGAVLTLIWLAFALVQMPAGILTDVFGEPKVLLASTGIGAASVALLVFAPSLAVFVVGAIFLGVGTGLFGPPRNTLLSRIYDEHSGTAYGITWAAGSLGGALVPFVATRITEAFSWRVGLGSTVVLFAAFLIAVLSSVPSRPASSLGGAASSPRKLPRRMLHVIRQREVFLLSLARIVMVFTYQALTTFFPTYLVLTKGMDQSTAATVFAMFFAGSVVVRPFAGYVADLVGKRRTLIGIAASHVLLLSVLPFVEGFLPLVAVALGLSLKTGAGPIDNAYLIEVLPDDAKGTGYGFLSTIFLSLGSTGSVVMGIIFDAEQFTLGMAVLAALSLVAVVLYALLSPSPTGVNSSA